MSSPKTTAGPRPKGRKRRPGTPHPSGSEPSEFDFAVEKSPAAASRNSSPSFKSSSDEVFDFAGIEHEQAEHSDGCLGISLAAVVNTIRGPLSARSLMSADPSIHEDNAGIFSPFHRFRSALQKSLSCTSGKTGNTSLAHYADTDERHLFDCDTFEGEKSLTQRAASWGTQETYDSFVRIRSNASSSRRVQFHYPPITSLRLRPRTESDDVKELFFAPEELDEIEDDRSDTRAADDVETLAVGSDNWDSLPGCSSSTVTASYDDDQDSKTGLPLSSEGASGVMFDGSPRKKNGIECDKRFVRGVQIMLREKSTG